MKILKDLNKLKEIISDIFQSKKILEKISNTNELHLKNINGSLKSFLVDYLTKNINKPIYIFVDNNETSIEFQNDFESLNISVPIFSSLDFIKNDNYIHSENHYFTDLVSKIYNDTKLIILLNKSILDFEIEDPKNYNIEKIELKVNNNYNFNELAIKLNELDFKKVEFVSNIGEYAIRGGIIDIYPLSAINPYRLEFWGDDIESIREFETISQRSIKNLNEIEIVSLIKSDISNKIRFQEVISKDSLIFYDDLEFYINENQEKFEVFKKVIFNSLNKNSIDLKSKPQSNYNTSIKDLTTEIINYDSVYNYHVTAESKNHIERIYNILSSNLENDFEYEEDYALEFLNKSNWYSSFLSNGFSIDNIKVIAEHEFFKRNKKTSKNSTSKSKVLLQELNSLKNGDYIVHEDKGIAKFQGFRSINIGDSTQDCIQLEFDGGDLLYVNMNYINKIQRYSAQEGLVPKVSKLGSAEWERRKSRHKKKIKEIARDLIKLYAKRKMQPGFAFDKDSIWQKEFEASFIYDDTIDQKSATEEIKRDMESSMPMDRLLCGDVGFGKTEIAVRAAFKAVQSGKQVAVLVPTTILAHQHIMSFKDRLSRYPVRIEVLSRFVSSKKQKEIIQDLKIGKVDILIGTHRILSKDIEFNNLGLLIVDEEQRFGVAAKEKLREIRVSIDTLTLTATPIPRTLNFSLLGARDLSIMETPPKNRLPVYTEIIEWQNEKLVEIIENEIKRGGQVFFVNDKVQDLELIQYDIKALLPKIKIGIAHGQMQSKELENVMQKFISGEIDLLLTTKIVESGLDIPNANTMIINKAQNFGLAELYQLRGRVGRSNQQAFCYLVIPHNQKLNQNSIKRLQAIEEFTDLGSGFQIALRDMEIRGAGNLLGSEQSGAIYDIGFELYQKVLDEAVNELKNEEFKELFNNKEENILDNISNYDVSIDTSEDCFIPEDYIHSETERFELYQKFYKLNSNKELNDLEKEIYDKFGKPPLEFKNLIFAIKLRIQAVKIGLEKLILKNNLITLELPNPNNEIFYSNVFPLMLDFIQTINDSRLIQGKEKLSIKIPINKKEETVEILWKLNKVIEELSYE